MERVDVSRAGWCSEPPAVAAGTVNVSSTSATPFLGTKTCVGLSDTECGDPCLFATVTSKLPPQDRRS